MFTFEYSFFDACIHPEQLKVLLNHSPLPGRLGSFASLSLPLQADTEEAALQEACHLAGRLDAFSLRGENAVDISSLVLSGQDWGGWSSFARELNRFSQPVSCPSYEVRRGKERIFSSDDDPERRFSALHKRTKVCLEMSPHHEFGLFSYDLAFVVPAEKGTGDNIHLFAGGGGGIYGGSPALAPRPATWLGEYSRADALKTANFLMELNREYGEADNPRKRRLKSLFASRGVDWVMEKLREAGKAPGRGEAPRFESYGEWGCDKSYNDQWVYVPSGWLADTGEYLLASALRAVLPLLVHPLRITPQGNLRVHAEDGAAIRELGRLLSAARPATLLRIASGACRGLPLCKRASAAASSVLEQVVESLDSLLESCGLAGESLIFRLSGCPNGCSRPLFAELALVGRAEGLYDLFAGGSKRGDRTALFVRKSVSLEDLPGLLTPVLTRYAAARKAGVRLSFGDWIYAQLLPSPEGAGPFA